MAVVLTQTQTHIDQQIQSQMNEFCLWFSCGFFFLSKVITCVLYQQTYLMFFSSVSHLCAGQEYFGDQDLSTAHLDKAKGASTSSTVASYIEIKTLFTLQWFCRK